MHLPANEQERRNWNLRIRNAIQDLSFQHRVDALANVLIEECQSEGVSCARLNRAISKMYGQKGASDA